MGFIDECIDFSGPVWDELLHHDWIETLLRGELSDERFQYWYASDLSFLGEHILSRGISKAPRDHPLRKLVVDVITADRDELELMRHLVDEHGTYILTPWSARPTREGYTNFLLRILYEGSFTQLCAASYPCFVFGEIIGQRYLDDPDPNVPAGQAEWMRTLHEVLIPLQAALGTEVDEMGPQVPQRERDEILWSFLRATQHQIRTFDAAWALTDPWPGEGDDPSFLSTPPERLRERSR
jgi:thiaminase/transcriptional activator TenA